MTQSVRKLNEDGNLVFELKVIGNDNLTCIQTFKRTYLLLARDALACSQLVKYEVRWHKVCPEFVIKYSEMTLPHF